MANTGAAGSHTHPQTPDPTLATQAQVAALAARLAVLEAPKPVLEALPTFFDDFTGDLSKWVGSQWPTTALSKESDNSYSLVAGPGDIEPQVTIQNGVLRIRCERGSTPSGRAWRSGAIATKAYGKPPLFAQLYGRFEVRAKLPKGKGMWPAPLWLLAVAGSGYVPEIDVIEAYPGYRGATPSGGTTDYTVTQHYGLPGSAALPSHAFSPHASVDLTDDFHVYGIDWRKDLLVGLLDGAEVGRITADVPSEAMFLVIDNVVGSFAGPSDATTPSPADLLVDWVRVRP